MRSSFVVRVVATLAFTACASSSEPPTPPPMPVVQDPQPTPTPPSPTPPPPTPTPVPTPTPPEVAVVPTGPQAVDMAGFATTCRTDDDCTLVRPSPCGHCGCTDTPLASREEARFREAMTGIQCAPPDPATLQISCGGCPGYLAVCQRGRCAVRTH